MISLALSSSFGSCRTTRTSLLHTSSSYSSYSTATTATATIHIYILHGVCAVGQCRKGNTETLPYSPILLYWKWSWWIVKLGLIASDVKETTVDDERHRLVSMTVPGKKDEEGKKKSIVIHQQDGRGRGYIQVGLWELGALEHVEPTWLTCRCKSRQILLSSWHLCRMCRWDTSYRQVLQDKDDVITIRTPCSWREQDNTQVQEVPPHNTQKKIAL